MPFFWPLPSFKLQCISLYSCLLSFVPLLLSQPPSLPTRQHVPTPPSLLIYFPFRRHTCSIVTLAEVVRSTESTFSPFKAHLNYSLKTTPRYISTSTASSSFCLCPLHRSHLQSHLTHHHSMLSGCTLIYHYWTFQLCWFFARLSSTVCSCLLYRYGPFMCTILLILMAWRFFSCSSRGLY